MHCVADLTLETRRAKPRYELKIMEALNPTEAAQGRGPQPKQRLGRNEHVPLLFL